ncbi:twitching motility protein [Oxalobacteraceae bacterium OM1]|nr:twitching motility protein [Oxalobacteraceae bacterium OM1]
MSGKQARATQGELEGIKAGSIGGAIPGFDDFGSLIERIIRVLNSSVVFSDIFLHEDSPIMLKQSKRLVPVSNALVTASDMMELFDALERNWRDFIGRRAFDRAIDLSNWRIRANCFTYGARRQYGCVIRRFPAVPVPLVDLGVGTEALEFVGARRGLVLVVGDTGQGKSTTIASMLDHINSTRAAHILTFEDPIEQRLAPKKSLITQREVGPDGDVESFYAGALDALRERPDVVMIGEIREPEVAREAVALAESGPLVFATLHARSVDFAVAKMHRLLGGTEMASEALAHSLRGVLCQALVPSAEGDRSYLVTECFSVTKPAAGLVQARDYDGIRAFLDNGGDGKSHAMNSHLAPLISQKKISVDDARIASTDRPGLDRMLGMKW